jgi:menaquinone reductase, integral membrane subunit
VEKISRKRLVRPGVLELLGRISGLLLAVYVLAKALDTLIWINRTSPDSGFPAAQYYTWQPFGTWILFAEIVVFGLAPALVLLTPRLRARRGWLVSAAAMACLGVALNRFVQTVQTLAVPTLSFDKFLSYYPSWQEVGTFLAVVAYGVLVYSLSFRYFQLFPEERELKIESHRQELDEELVAAGERY